MDLRPSVSIDTSLKVRQALPHGERRVAPPSPAGLSMLARGLWMVMLALTLVATSGLLQGGTCTSAAKRKTGAGLYARVEEFFVQMRLKRWINASWYVAPEARDAFQAYWETHGEATSIGEISVEGMVLDQPDNPTAGTVHLRITEIVNNGVVVRPYKIALRWALPKGGDWWITEEKLLSSPPSHGPVPTLIGNPSKPTSPVMNPLPPAGGRP